MKCGTLLRTLGMLLVKYPKSVLCYFTKEKKNIRLYCFYWDTGKQPSCVAVFLRYGVNSTGKRCST